MIFDIYYLFTIKYLIQFKIYLFLRKKYFQMFYFSVCALVLVVCGVYGEELQREKKQVVTAAPSISPYYPNQNPLIPGYNPNYRTNNNQVPILSYSSNQANDGSYSFRYLRYILFFVCLY